MKIISYTLTMEMYEPIRWKFGAPHQGGVLMWLFLSSTFVVLYYAELKGGEMFLLELT